MTRILHEPLMMHRTEFSPEEINTFYGRLRAWYFSSHNTCTYKAAYLVHTLTMYSVFDVQRGCM